MPTIALKSKVRTASEHCTLSLNIRHRLLFGQSSNLVFDMKPTMPEAVDILLFSNLLITVSGSLDGTRIAPLELKASHTAHHLVDFLQTNAGELGINAVSDLYISEDTNLLSLTLTASRHFPASADTLPHLKLIALDLDYVWQTNSNAGRLDAAINPFSRHLSLPYLTATDNAVGRFVKFHLVRRYPLIFGPWCKQLDIECSFFPSILISIQSIMERSRSPGFQATCRNLFKLCKREMTSASISTASTLSKYLGLAVETYSAPTTCTYNEEEAFFLRLERFYRLGMKRPIFRHLSLAPTITSDSSEDLLSDNAFGVNYFSNSNQSSEASGLRPHMSLFEGSHMHGWSDLELNTEDEHRVTSPNPYRYNTQWTPTTEKDDIHDWSEDEVGPYGTSEQRSLTKNDGCHSSELVADSDIDCLLEQPGSTWSPDSLSSQQYEQDSLGKVSSSGVDSMAQPLKMSASLYLPVAVPDPFHLGCGPALQSLTQSVSEDITQACPVSQESSSGDHYFESESDMQIDLIPDLVSKPVITDDDHGFYFSRFSPKPSQALISTICRYGAEALATGGGNSGVITDDDCRFFIIEYDSDDPI